MTADSSGPVWIPRTLRPRTFEGTTDHEVAREQIHVDATTSETLADIERDRRSRRGLYVGLVVLALVIAYIVIVF